MHWLDKLFYILIIIPARWLIKPSCIPVELEQELGIDKNQPIIYLLKTRSITDLLALNKCAKSLGLPSSTSIMQVDDTELSRNMCLRNPNSLFTKKALHTDIKTTATTLFQLHRTNPNLDIQIVPVTILWGRAPDKNHSGWSDIIANSMSPSWLRKFFIVLFLGRNNFVCFSQAVSSKKMSQLPGSDQQIAQKLIRVAGTHFFRKVQTIKGPNLLDKQQLNNSIMGSQSVALAISNEAKSAQVSHQQAKAKAQSYLDEIAADYREGLVRVGDKLLTKVWNKIYNGIEVHHAAGVRELAQKGHEIIYVPCHRSHMDYLLLTYVIYHQGLVTPHIAAGINLNFWPAGGLLRKAGAFYIRRTFAGQPLYTAVFREYLELLFNKGYSVKFFPEGGRSRTGRLLPPKTGMFAMTLQGILKGINRPVSIVPVYIGYDHVMEVGSYLKELKGASKKKESFWQVFGALKKLKNYGIGHLSFGQPINLTNYLDEHQTNWRDDKYKSAKPEWLNSVVNHLATDVMSRINQAAAISNMSMVATCLLATPRHAMSTSELEQSIDCLNALLRQVPFSPQMVAPKQNGKQILAATLKLNKLQLHKDNYGQIVSIKPDTVIPLTYYRNNIQHLFVLPSLLITIIASRKQLTETELLNTASPFFNLLKTELFIYMNTEQGEQHLRQLVSGMLDLGLITQHQQQLSLAKPISTTFSAAMILNQSIQDTLNRYAVVLQVINCHQPISQADLQQKSRHFAERLSILHGLGSPEFFDKNVLASCVNGLITGQIIRLDQHKMLHATENSQKLLSVLTELIAPEIVQRLTKA
jgi:glycerol-3-phosphate O-acyltransferase